MTGAEQVIERIEETALPSVSPSLSTPTQRAVPSGTAEPAKGTSGTFSPDPARRTDRYRLVTPYCLRL